MSKVQVKQDARLADLIGYRLRVLTQDGRVYVGELLAFDKFMNLVLKGCIEERIPKTQVDNLQSGKDVKVERRTLGLAILRGEQVLSSVVQDRPQLTKKERLDGVKKQEKQLRKEKRTRNKQLKEGGRVEKAKVEKRKFQPPPGFKSRKP
ncbi:SMB1 (YER029C) [Zygosaccharomyces parabailii]|nr:SMB1 (YER029C) [Zygosaccharomyces parabailii]CDH11860.1 related to Small nuclear ribonucleoprotein-associated protein B [Zygosaccharomyces bailii ISA1307]